MSKPNDRGSVSQFEGNKNVSAGSRNDPGVWGLINPSANIISTTKRKSVRSVFKHMKEKTNSRPSLVTFSTIFEAVTGRQRGAMIGPRPMFEVLLSREAGLGGILTT
jgi:hypothetical protein